MFFDKSDFRLGFSDSLTCHLQPLSHRHAVGDLSLFYQSAVRQLKLRNTSSSIVLPCAEEEARIWKLSRRREDRSRQQLLLIQ
nr:unnamed protein product [Callosobruchus chinensis]